MRAKVVAKNKRGCENVAKMVASKYISEM